jgi:hypothetical protein
MTKQNEQVRGPWTAEEVATFGEALATFRDGLPSRQRDAFTAILATAAHQGGDGDDTQGHASNIPPMIDFIRWLGERLGEPIDWQGGLERWRQANGG